MTACTSALVLQSEQKRGDRKREGFLGRRIEKKRKCKEIKRGDEDVRPAGGKQLCISSKEIWRCLTGPHIVFRSLSEASLVYHHCGSLVLTISFYRKAGRMTESLSD